MATCLAIRTRSRRTGRTLRIAILRDELGYDEVRSYDAMGRLTQQNHRGGLLVDYYAYDLLGQRTKHWNSLLGTGNVETTDYDMQGRVPANVTFGGDTTTTSYTWNGAIVTTGMGTFGGWNKVVTRAGRRRATRPRWTFTAATSRGPTPAATSPITATTRPAAYVSQAGVTGQSQTYHLFQHRPGRDDRRHRRHRKPLRDRQTITATYGYDATGNRTYEGYAGAGLELPPWRLFYSWTQTLQNATITYDAIGPDHRLPRQGCGGTDRIDVETEYDLAGNVRRTTSIPIPISLIRNARRWPPDHWYKYDTMNRMTLANG